MSSAAAKAGRRHEETIVKRVSKRSHHDDHGGNWKVAFADFCLALLCLFLVLWVLSARDAEESQRKAAISAVYDGGAGLFDGDGREPGFARLIEPLVSSPAASERSEAGAVPATYESDDELEALAAALERLGEEANLKSNLQAVITPSGLRVMLHDTHRRGIFELGSAVPEPAFENLMQRMGELFSRIGNPLLVVGHTDAVPFRNPGARSNWHLSTDRAMAARGSLLQGGLPLQHLLQVVGMADRAPLDTDDPRGALNRRIEFLVLTKRRAQMLEQMFGTPHAVTPLMNGVDAVATRAEGESADA